MVLFWAALVFVVVCVLVWLMLFAEARELFTDCCRRIAQGLRGRTVHGGRQLADRLGNTGKRMHAEGAGVANGLLRHRWVLAIAVVMLCGPALIILMTRQQVVFEGFDGRDMSESRTMIAELLRGERLVPPPPPPPAIFRTAEVRRLKPEIVTADRKWARINPDLQQRVLAIYQVMRDQYGIEMVLVEGYRSPERQAKLKSGGRATNAGAWSSCHQYGLALDSAPLREGRLQWDMSDPWTKKAYFLYGELARQAALEWGGNWSSLKDYVHVEMGSECKQAKRARRARSG